MLLNTIQIVCCCCGMIVRRPGSIAKLICVNNSCASALIIIKCLILCG